MSRIARILLGGVDPLRKFRDLSILAVPWLLVDIVTKCLALGWLAGKELQFLEGSVRLQLSINESLFGSTQTPSRFGITHAMVLGAAMVQGLIAGAGFAFGRAEWTVVRKLVLMGLVVVVGPGLGVLLGSLFAGEPHRLVVHAARACGSLAVLLLALRLTRSRYLGLALGLWISGNLGNAINVLYYPRGVIDFIYVPRLRNFIGVFNLSDVALEVAKGLLILSPLALVLFRRLGRRSAAWERRLEYVNPPEPPTVTLPA
jgi:lipoprotein signal peptidase